jgi:quercetin dioxygenase-like cupin family protein
MVIQARRIASRITAAAATRLHTRGLRMLVAFVLATAVGIALASALGGEPSRSAHAEGAVIEPLARGHFPDDVRALLMVRLDGNHPMRVTHVNQASDAIAIKLTVPPGASVDWHMHTGPGIAVVAQGEITFTVGPDCLPRTYSAGSAFVHGTDSESDLAENLGDTDVIVYITFLGTPPGPPTLPHEASC